MTALHREYGDKGLAVVAVNGYGDAREVIEEWVRAKKLDHPIYFDGREVATATYFVTAYPTTFLVDRHGVIVERRIGFDPADLPDLRHAIEELLAAE